MKRPVFWVNSFNKGEYTYRACAGALAQDTPCNILFTDMQSNDDSWSHIERAVMTAPRGADHAVVYMKTPEAGVNTFKSLSDHFAFAVQKSEELFPESEWLLQCSADDFSLPQRARICMEVASSNKCDAIATTMFFTRHGEENNSAPVSGYPHESGYVHAGNGILKLAYGSVIAGYSMEFLKKAGGFDVTPDVFYGYLAALGRGFYCVAEPLHVNVTYTDGRQLGFGGKLASASSEEEMLRLKELNHFQLHRLYKKSLERANELYGQIPVEHAVPILNTILAQSMAWSEAREALHSAGITPGTL